MIFRYVLGVALNLSTYNWLIQITLSQHTGGLEI
jgi:hypothetical protein